MALEDELAEAVEAHFESLHNAPYEEIQRSPETLRALIAEYREKATDEDFEAFRIAEGLRQDKERDRYILERKHLDERMDAFSRVVGAYNREREKEGKPEHVFKDCTEHDHSEKKCDDAEAVLGEASRVGSNVAARKNREDQEAPTT